MATKVIHRAVVVREQVHVRGAAAPLITLERCPDEDVALRLRGGSHRHRAPRTGPEVMTWLEIYGRFSKDVNDPAAWAALEHRVRRWALRAFRQRGWDVVEDAVADACASTVLAFAQARGAETFSGFVYGHCLNVKQRMCLEVRESSVRLKDSEVAEDSAHRAGTPSQEQLMALREALEMLPARERLAVELRYEEERSAADIARRLGVTEGNARRIVFNGLSRLRRHLCGVAPAGSRLALAGPAGRARTQPAPR